ncbi:MAG: nickel pincer cofactor biosynthesis protein LarB [Pseudonocardiaceae bacterium]|nr:nickel pincer cofactor biosynthesis protein LarB [Pseudonocardiaceae bacterium]
MSGGGGFTDLGFARPDVGRESRQGLPEVVYGPGKAPGQIVAIVGSLLEANTGPVLATRLAPQKADEVSAQLPGGSYDEVARVLSWRHARSRGFRVVVASAGTSDGPVAAEAVAVATAIGLSARLLADVGVAGIHRLLAETDDLAAADALICVAGMDGALPSVVGGLVDCPVIAVPTSVGYGAALDGITPMLAMLTSCAAGVVVVNIDSGFGAAMAAHRIATVRERR